MQEKSSASLGDMPGNDLTAQVLVKLTPEDKARFEAICARVGDKGGTLARKVLLRFLADVESGRASPGGVSFAPDSPPPPVSGGGAETPSPLSAPQPPARPAEPRRGRGAS